jgi:hypothetical protein
MGGLLEVKFNKDGGWSGANSSFKAFSVSFADEPEKKIRNF